MSLHDAATKLGDQIASEAWFASVGVINGTSEDPDYRSIVIYTQTKKSIPIVMAAYHTFEGWPVRVEYMGKVKPA